MSINNTFKTQDLNLSAVLIASQFELNEVVRDIKGKSTFCFRYDEKIDKTIKLYWSNKLHINPHDLFNALKLLKNRIYSRIW